MFDRVHTPKSPRLEDSPFRCNPLIASLDPASVFLRGQRALVHLALDPQMVVAELPQMGPVLSIVRNPNAVFGRIRSYPELKVPTLNSIISSADGELTFDFARWNHALITVEEQPAGWLYAIEFIDVFGEVLHKVCLTPESDFVTFREWVELSQASEAVASRFRARGSFASNDCTCLPGEVMMLRAGVCRDFIDHLIESGGSARAVIGNSGIVLGADLAPESVQENGDWIFVSGRRCGLHLEVGRLSEAFIHRDDDGVCTLNACETEGGLVCSFTAPQGLSNWDQLLSEFTAPYHATEK